MTLTLDPQSEESIQREIARGHFQEPAEVIAHALHLLEAEQARRERKSKAWDDAFGLWKDMEEDGLAYQERLRNEW